MFVRLKTYPNNHYAVQIVESSYRDGQQVRQRIVSHVGCAQTEMELTKLKELAEYIIVEMSSVKEPALFPVDELAQMVIERRHRSEADSTPLNVNLKKLREEHRIITGVHEIYGKMFDHAGYHNLLKNCPVSRNIFKDITLTRIARLSSKMASVDLLEKDFGITHSLDAVYLMIDHLDEEKLRR